MAVLPYRRLVLVTFILICFFLATAKARSLKVVHNKEVNEQNKGHDEEKVVKVQDRDQEEEVTERANDLLTMDYAPARKKPPIHN